MQKRRKTMRKRRKIDFVMRKRRKHAQKRRKIDFVMRKHRKTMQKRRKIDLFMQTPINIDLFSPGPARVTQTDSVASKECPGARSGLYIYIYIITYNMDMLKLKSI